MQDLGTLLGGSYSRATAINDARVIVGSSSGDAGDHAFIWTPDVRMQDLNGTDSAGMRVLFVEAHAIDASGQILVTGRGVNEPMPSSPGEHECEPAPHHLPANADFDALTQLQNSRLESLMG